MSAAGPPRLRRPAVRLGSAVVRITCPDCGRELASATYGARALLELHEPTCTAAGGEGSLDEGRLEAATPAAD